MQMQAKLFGIVLCALAAAACGGDGGQNGGNGGDGGDGGDTSTVTGTVYTWEQTEKTVAGATVGVFGTQLSATTDANGAFVLENVPNGDVFFTTMANGNWSVIDYYEVPTETSGGADLIVVPDSEIQRWEGILGVSIPASQGAVDILYYEGAVGGETGAITPAAGDPPFTFDGWDPVPQTNVIADDEGFGELFFTSVDPANETIRPTVTGSPDQTSCVLDETPGIQYPIMAKTLTIVYAYCEPL